ncbi:MAG: hypothetical protein RMK20_06650, partial [Verrucomicrobiales bacterium]|nr:hypothetical protein [Verrucomicrobiales bacterium]
SVAQASSLLVRRLPVGGSKAATPTLKTLNLEPRTLNFEQAMREHRVNKLANGGLGNSLSLEGEGQGEGEGSVKHRTTNNEH